MGKSSTKLLANQIQYCIKRIIYHCDMCCILECMVDLTVEKASDIVYYVKISKKDRPIKLSQHVQEKCSTKPCVSS